MRSLRRPMMAMSIGLLMVLPTSPAASQDACRPTLAPAVPPAITGGDAALAGEQPGPGPAGTPIHCWTGATGDAVLGSQAVATGDLIATLSERGEVVAFTPDGAEMFRLLVADPTDGLPGGLTTDGDLLYIGVPAGVIALSTIDGSEAWRVEVAAADSPNVSGGSRPVVKDGRVYTVLTSSPDGRSIERALVALDAASGIEAWRQALFAEFPAGPIAADGELVSLWDGRGDVIAFEAASGDERWRTGIDVLGITPSGPVAMAGGRIATILTGGEVVVLSASDGSRIWSVVPPPGLAAALTLQGDALLVNVITRLVALDAATGAERWVAPIQERAATFPYRAVPAVVDGSVILGTTDPASNAALIAWDLASGAETWRLTTDVFGAILAPIVTGGRVYAAVLDLNETGGLFAFGEPAG